MPVSLFLALRYLKPKLSLFTLITIISVGGVALGVMILIVTMAIMAGFGDMWRDKLMKFQSHVTVRGPNLSDYDVDLRLRHEKEPGVIATSPAILTRVMIKHNGVTVAPAVKGIDPLMEIKTSTIHENLLLGLQDLTDLQDDEVILGHDLAIEIGAEVGDTINIYSPNGFSDADTVRLPEEVYVVGTFKIGMMIFDKDFMIATLETARDLANLEEGITEIVVQLDDPMKAFDTSESLQLKLGPSYRVSNWIRDNNNTFAALETEKDVMFVLLLSIAMVGGFSMVCSLLIITIQKTQDIGLLKSMGFRTTQIVGVFTITGFILGTIGVTLGFVGGLLVVIFRSPIMDLVSKLRGTPVFPPEIYQFDTLPAKIIPSDLWTIVFCGMLICILAGTAASLPAVMLRPVDALRHD